MAKRFLDDMTIAIIGTGSPTRESALFEACLLQRNVGVRHFAIMEVMADITDGHHTLRDAYQRDPQGRETDNSRFKLQPDSPLNMVSAVIDVAPAVGPYGLWAMQTLRRHGLLQCNTAEAMALSNDKWWSYLALTEMRVPTPKSALVHHQHELIETADRLGFPLVVKDPKGAQGAGVRLAHDRAELASAAAELDIALRPLMLQHYIECGSRDRRVVVVGGEVVDAHDRVATTPGEFRANPALGSKTARRAAEPDEIDIALRAASAIGLDVAGMDMSRVASVLPGREYLGEGQAFIIETNESPGFHPTDYGPERIVDHLLARLALR
jgi:RimK family alpha-L-glutamate ligase